jgi:thioredoxin
MRKIIYLLIVCFIVSSTAVAQKSTKSEIEELSLKTFKKKVWNFDRDKLFKKEGKIPIILDFYATWCKPCKMMAPHLRALQEKYRGKLIIYEIDIDKEPELAQRFNISSIPVLVYASNQKSYKSELGYRDYDELEKHVNSYFFQK